MIALASLPPDYKTGAAVQMEVTVEAVRHKAGARVTELPFFNPPRKTATPV
jgi:hypothetical protein